MTTPASATRYSAEQYLGLIEQGVLGPDDHVELLEGVITEVSPQGPKHAAVVSRLHRLLLAAIGGRAVVRSQMPLRLGASVPEPDVLVLPGCEADYEEEHPNRALLVVEVADRSVAADRLSKARIYAAAGVPEYWIVNLRGQCIEILSDPEPATGTYRSRYRAVRGERITPGMFQGFAIDVAAILSPR